jgi:hypothetical protein
MAEQNRLEDIDLSGGDQNNDPEDNSNNSEDLLKDDLLTNNQEVDDVGNIEDGDEGESQSDGIDVKTLGDLATAIEVDPASLYDLEIPMQNGLDSVTLAELKDAYQAMKSGDDPLALDRQKFEQDKIDFHNQTLQVNAVNKQSNAEIDSAKAEMTSIQSSFDQIDWAEFEKQNPAEAVLQKQKFGEAYNAANYKFQSAQQQLQQSMHNQQLQYNQQESQKVIQLIPEWSDRKKFEDDKPLLRAFISKYGFSDQEITNIGEARLIKFAYDFMTLSNSVDNASPKKIDNVRKLSSLKSGPLRIPKKGKKTDELVKAGIATTNPRAKASIITELLNT